MLQHTLPMVFSQKTVKKTNLLKPEVARHAAGYLENLIMTLVILDTLLKNGGWMIVFKVTKASNSVLCAKNGEI